MCAQDDFEDDDEIDDKIRQFRMRGGLEDSGDEVNEEDGELDEVCTSLTELQNSYLCTQELVDKMSKQWGDTRRRFYDVEQEAADSEEEEELGMLLCA